MKLWNLTYGLLLIFAVGCATDENLQKPPEVSWDRLIAYQSGDADTVEIGKGQLNFIPDSVLVLSTISSTLPLAQISGHVFQGQGNFAMVGFENLLNEWLLVSGFDSKFQHQIELHVTPIDGQSLTDHVVLSYLVYDDFGLSTDASIQIDLPPGD